MIQRLVGFCLMVGLSVAGPISRKAAYAPAPPGERPPCATKGMTFCEDVDKYPTKLIQRLLQKKSFESYDFFVDEREGLDEPPEHVLLYQEIGPTTVPKVRKPRSLEKESGDGALSTMCSVPSKEAMPKIVSDSKGEWQFMSQAEASTSDHEFKVQVCDEKEECQKSCNQFFTPVTMTESTDQGEKLKIIWVPSSCRCFDESDNLI